MAYRSSGADNDGMISNLKRFGIISSSTVEEGFRQVDRKFFVPKGHLRMAHTDQPIKEDNIHISAPHIYGVVVEALELPKNAPLSFLNAGSGTGYLTCVAASILGPKSIHYCVEIHLDVIEHSKEAIANWKHDCSAAQKIQQINIIPGNALNLDVEIGECALGFDRIYIGAAIEVYQLPMFTRLLKPGGILVGPVDGDLLKVVRREGDQEYTQETLSAVRFAPLLSHPRVDTVIPMRVWTPSWHKFYPDSFQNSCKAILLCSNSNYVQPEKWQPKGKLNVAALLPRALWLEILSYTRRDWFEAPQSEVEFLRQRLKEEQENAERARRSSLEANLRCHIVERERDMYKILALRLRARIQHNGGSRGLIDEDLDVNMLDALLLSRHGSESIIGFADVFQRSRDQAASFSESGDDNDSDDDVQDTNAIEEDQEMLDYEEYYGSSVFALEEIHHQRESQLVQGSFSGSTDMVRTVSVTEANV